MILHNEQIRMSIESPDPDFELVRDGDLWVATHVETGVASHGDRPDEAVEMACEAAEIQQQDHEPGDDDYQREMLDRFSIDVD